MFVEDSQVVGIFIDYQTLSQLTRKDSLNTLWSAV